MDCAGAMVMFQCSLNAVNFVLKFELRSIHLLGTTLETELKIMRVAPQCFDRYFGTPLIIGVRFPDLIGTREEPRRRRVKSKKTVKLDKIARLLTTTWRGE